MSDQPVPALGANLVQIIGFFVVLGGVFNLPSAGGWVAVILGGVLIAAATARYIRYTRQ